MQINARDLQQWRQMRQLAIPNYERESSTLHTYALTNRIEKEVSAASQPWQNRETATKLDPTATKKNKNEDTLTKSTRSNLPKPSMLLICQTLPWEFPKPDILHPRVPKLWYLVVLRTTFVCGLVV